MIPKIIHYIWFGGKPFPKKIKKCMDSWKKFLPDYKIMFWNEETFDINSIPFTKQAYENKKWAFVSDYVRVYALEKYGGWYLDTDVEILKPLFPFEDKRIVLGTDSDGALTALMGSEKGHPFWSKILDLYANMSFVRPDGSLNIIVNNTHLQDILVEYGFVMKNKYQELKEGIYIYPDEYFHVADVEKGTLNKTNNSYAIHWHTLLWTSNMHHLMRYFRLYIMKPIFGGDNFLEIWNKLKKIFKR